MNKKCTVKKQDETIDIMAMEKALKYVLYGIIGLCCFYMAEQMLCRFEWNYLPVKAINYIFIMGSFYSVFKGLKSFQSTNRLFKTSYLITALLFIASAITEGIYVFKSWKWNSGSLFFPNDFSVTNQALTYATRITLILAIVAIFLFVLGILNIQDKLNVKKYLLSAFLFFYYGCFTAFYMADYSDYGKLYGITWNSNILGYIGLLASILIIGLVSSYLFIDNMVNGDLHLENKCKTSTSLSLAGILVLAICFTTVFVVELSPRYGFSVDSILATDFESLNYTQVEKGEYVFNIYSYEDIDTSETVALAEVAKKGLINHKIDLALAKYLVYNENDELVATIAEYESSGKNIYAYNWYGPLKDHILSNAKKEDVTGKTVIVNGKTLDLEYYCLFEYEGDIETFEIPGLNLKLQ